MCAKVALKAKNILELDDASQIYDEYFEPLFNEVELLKESDNTEVISTNIFLFSG